MVFHIEFGKKILLKILLFNMTDIDQSNVNKSLTFMWQKAKYKSWIDFKWLKSGKNYIIKLGG